MLNHFVNALPSTANHRFTARQRFQVHASQTLVATGQYEYGAATHGLCYFGAALPSNKLNLLSNAQVARQRFKLGAIRTFSDDAASELGKRGSENSERSQDQFVAFAAQQIANHQNLWIERPHPNWIWREKTWIHTVVDDGAAGFRGRSGSQNFLHLAADTDYGPCRAVDVHRSFPAPGRRNSAQKARVKHIQPMDSNHERNIQTPGNQPSRVTAGQSRMSVDHVNSLHPMQLLYSSQKTGVEQLPRG